MSEIKRTFLQGKLNKDFDERLVPDGQYIDAHNIQVAKSEGSDVGAIENSLGNEKKTSFNLTNATTIGKYEDNSNQVIYYFVTADEKDIVIEYDDKSEAATVLLESTRVNGKTLLNFQTDKLITGVSKIISGKHGDDLLAWTDDNEQPRIINIERAKGYGPDGFVEDDISLIKKPPLYCPNLKLTYNQDREESNINDKFLSFAYAYRYLDGEMSALSPFTTAAFSPNEFNLDFHTVENEGMQNIFSAVDIEFNTGSKRVTDVMLVFKESNSNNVYVIETFNKKDSQWEDDQIQKFRFSNSKIYRVLDENELFRLYDNVPRKAKAQDIIGNRLAYGNYLEGYDLLDKYGERVKMDYNLSLFTKSLVGDILPYVFVTLSVENDLITIDFTGIELKNQTRLTFGVALTERADVTGTFNGSFDFILNKDYTDVSELAQDPEFINFVEQVMTKSFLSEYTTTPPDNSVVDSNTTFSIDSFTATSLTLLAPTVTYEIDNTPADATDADFTYQTNKWGFQGQTQIYFRDTATDASCKTNRSYEVAQIYLDEYGRATTALTSPDNTLYIPQENSVYQNKIRVNINHKPPSWAKYFRFAIKQNKKEYQTIYASIFYEDRLFRWIKLDGANKDKVAEGDTLIVKSDINGAVLDIVKVRVLEVKTQPLNFLSENLNEEGEEIREEPGLYMKIKTGAGFNMSYSGNRYKELSDYGEADVTRPSIVLGPLGETNADGIYSDFPIRGGSTIEFNLYSWENDRIGGGRNDEHRYNKKHPVYDNYDNLELWFETEVAGFEGEFSPYEFFRDTKGQLFMRITSVEDGTTFQESYIKGTLKMVFTQGMVIFETEPEDTLSDVYYEGSQTFEVIDGSLHEGNVQMQTITDPAIIELDFFNCYSLGNGVESYRYKDALNAKWLNIDTRPTAKSESEYREIRRYADITYSAPYVESLGINGLNNFNLSTANYKDDIVKKYGSIQKLIARDTDLVLFQEDKVSRVLYGKELIVGPDGSSNLASIAEVLGSQVMYSGEHGVSRNPESIAMAGNRIWFTDEKRNQVCRLSTDGITVISDYGMLDWFRDMFTDSMNKAKLGAYDPYNHKYVLSSRDQIIYNPFLGINCSQTLKKKNFSGTLKAEIDFGLATGDSGISITTDKQITVTLIWNEQSFPLVVDTAGTITFNKEGLLPRTAELIVDAPEKANFEIAGNCAIVEQLTVISIVRGHVKDAGTVLTNRYKWIFGDYSSNYKRFREEFPEEGGIAVWNEETGDEGSGYIPKTGSSILMESYRGYNDTGSFGDGDTMGYLISNTYYPEAQADTAIANSTKLIATTERTEGGESISKVNFDFLRPNAEKYLYLVWDYTSLNINIDTKIYIYFDSSGSMNSTLYPLQTMRDTLLKDALLPFYENNEIEYNNKVQVISNSSESTILMLDFLQEPVDVGNVIVLVFQDESSGRYHGSEWPTASRGSYYDQHITDFRNRLASFAEGYYRGVVFQVSTEPQLDDQDVFVQLLQAIQNGTHLYSGEYGLADKPEVGFEYGVTPGASPEYYKELIMTAITELTDR